MTQEPMFSKIKGTVEADETYIGGKEKNKHMSKRTPNNQGRSTKTKTPVFALIERGGQLRARKITRLSGAEIKAEIRKNVSPEATIVTDQYPAYFGLDKEFAGHEVVDHGKGEYVRGNAYTNTLEGWFSLLKRGVTGTFHHVSEQHLDRYVDEFVFRYNNRELEDGERMVKALERISGKRLIYRDLGGTQ